MSRSIATMTIAFEQDVVAARQQTRRIASLLGFETQDQTRLATAVSEIVRNAYRYAGNGEISFVIEGERSPQVLIVTVTDHGPGIADLEAVLSGQYRSSTGMGLGLIGSRRLVDQLDIRSDRAHGTEVRLKKLFPPASPVVDDAGSARLKANLAASAKPSALEESQQQQRELLRALAELRERQEELRRANHELEDTNRGVVALYAELDEKADHLRRADEMKSRFLSNMSHEFRTPLNSVRALSGLLLDHVDGPLSGEQRTQVEYIRKAAADLSELVEDLLDLAKIEAGRIDVQPTEFTIGNLFSALRGMLRPLLVSESVVLRFEAAPDLPALFTDEAKVSQILRNFISNALKFTERGEVRVTAELADDDRSIVLAVADTGIGIEAAHHDLVFEEFAQVKGPLQKRVKGTGLGLPLCRRLADLLGGNIALASEVGVGSTFTATLPIRYEDRVEVATPPVEVPLRAAGSNRLPVLIVEDDAELQRYYAKILRSTAFRSVAARSLREAREAMRNEPFVAIILDILLRGEETWQFLTELKADPETRAIPVIVATEVDEEGKIAALGADAYLRKPVDRHRLLSELKRLTGSRILVIDDDPATRYALRRLLGHAPYRIVEASDGQTGWAAAHAMRPQLILLDLGLPDMSGNELLDRLKRHPATRDIPVVVATAHDLSAAEISTLGLQAQAVLTKLELEERVVETVAAALQAAVPIPQ